MLVHIVDEVCLGESIDWIGINKRKSRCGAYEDNFSALDGMRAEEGR